MEIQNIPGFRLAATTVTGSPPSSRYTRGRGGANGLKRWRTPAESKTLDFSAGVEPYIQPRTIPKRPSSSRPSQRSKDKEIQFDIEQVETKCPAFAHKNDVHQNRDARLKQSLETTDNKNAELGHESDLHGLANATYQEWTDPSAAIFAPRTPLERCQTAPRHELGSKVGGERELLPLRPHKVSPQISVQIHEHDIKLHPELRRSAEPLPSPSPRQWFEKTLQQYEDLKKSVDAQISSAPSSINERLDIAADLNENGANEYWAETPRRGPPAAFSDVGIPEEQPFSLNTEANVANSKIAQLRKLRSEVTRHQISKKEVPPNMPKEGRPLWERPEHATGKYLIHGTSKIPGMSLPNEETPKKSAVTAEKKKTGNLTSYSCGCSAKQVLPALLTTYSCGCPPQQVLPTSSCPEPPLHICQCPLKQQQLPSKSPIEGPRNDAVKKGVPGLYWKGSGWMEKRGFTQPYCNAKYSRAWNEERNRAYPSITTS